MVGRLLLLMGGVVAIISFLHILSSHNLLSVLRNTNELVEQIIIIGFVQLL
jgi:hypothetical protein